MKNIQKYAKKIKLRQSFIVFKKSKPLFKISPTEKNLWEKVIDFTKTEKKGINIKKILQHL